MKLYFRSLFCCVWTPADSLAVCSACCQLSIPHKNTPGTMEPTAAQTKKKFTSQVPHIIQIVWYSLRIFGGQRWPVRPNCRPLRVTSTATVRYLRCLQQCDHKKPPYISGARRIQKIFFFTIYIQVDILETAIFFFIAHPRR